MANCSQCRANLALVGKVHRCHVPIHGIPGKTKVTYASANGDLVEIERPIVNNKPEHVAQIRALLTKSAVERQDKWRKANQELNRQRAREGMRKRRDELKANATS